MIVSDFIDNINQTPQFVHNSIHYVEGDKYGCVYKYLVKNETATIAARIEVFLEFDETEESVDLLNKTVVNIIEILPAK